MPDQLPASILARSTQVRFLQYFVCVAEELSFSRAAERLHVSQPSLSRQIRMLESRLGGALFERTRRHVALTDAGALFLEEARATLSRFDQAMSRGRQAMRGEFGTLTIAYASAAIFNTVTTQLIARCAKAWPGVELRTEAMAKPAVIAAVAQQRADFGVVHSEGDLREFGSDSSLAAIPLDEEGIVLGVHTQHALAGRASVALKELVDESYFSLPNSDSYGLGSPLRRLTALRGEPIRIALHVQSAPAMVYLAAQGLGVALLPASMTSLQAPGICYIPVEDAGPPRILTLVHLPQQQTAPMRNFLSLLDAAAAPARS